MLYLCAFIDRSNMGNARILGLQKDLSLGCYKFNEVLTAFFAAYIAFEMNFVPPFPNLKDTTDYHAAPSPSNIMCKIIGSRFWLGFFPIGFGLITMCIAFVESFPGIVVARILLGAFESGILPGLIFAFSRYYRRGGIVTRIG
jgi:MFS family permease